MGMRRLVLCGIAAAISMASVATAGVYDDVAAWWHLDFADAGTPAATEIRDARTWYDAAAYTATSVQGAPTWTTSVSAGGRGPAGGQVYGGRALDLSPTVNGTTVTPDGFNVSNLNLSGDATMVTRFKWDGYAAPATSQSAWLYNNAHTANGGWLFGLTGGSAVPTVLQYPTGQFSPAWTTTPGTWYDMAVVIDENGANDTVTFHRWEDGGNLQSQTFNANWDFNAVGTSGTHVGFEAPTGDNSVKAFDGSVDHIAVWNRALDVNEIAHAFGAPSPLGTLGIDNNTNTNFNIEGAAGNTYNAGDPWGKLSRALTQYGNSQIDINLAVTPEQAALPYVFHLDTSAGRTATFPMSVWVNGTSLGDQPVARDGDAQWVVPAGLLNAGGNTVSLRYTGPFVDYGAGGSYLTWDSMELGGAWQVGLDNGTTSEFIEEWNAPADYYVTDPNFKHVRRAVTGGAPQTNLHFDLSDELAARDYRYSFEVYGPENPETGFQVLVNGTPMLADHGSHGEQFSIDVPRDLMQSGDNAITMQYDETDGTKRWIQWDWMRLEPLNTSLSRDGHILIGIDNDTHTEFAEEWLAPDDFDSRSLRWKNFERAITEGDPVTNIHFAVDGPLADIWGAALNPGDNVVSLEYADQAGAASPWIVWDWLRLDIDEQFLTLTLETLGPVHPFNISLNGTPVATLVSNPGVYTVTLAQVPEPATLALLGLAGLLLARRRRRA